MTAMSALIALRDPVVLVIALVDRAERAKARLDDTRARLSARLVEAGPAVIAGHVDSASGPAVFFRLRELRPGHTVQVELADGARLTFVVEQARSFPKAAFPTAEMFGPAPWAALRLVTCGGDFDRARGSYRDNLVVFARLARVAR